MYIRGNETVEIKNFVLAHCAFMLPISIGKHLELDFPIKFSYSTRN